MIRIYQHDANYCRIKQFSALYLLKANNGEAALVDSGTPQNFSAIQAFLNKNGIHKNQLRSIFLTHSHLDHSGNISLFARHYPNIKIYTHPLTARVLNNPELIVKRMAESMNGKYESEFYNDVQKVSKRFFIPIYNEMQISFGENQYIYAFYTPGHSKDHLSFYEPLTKTLFTGDAIGQIYPFISTKIPVFSFPPLSCPNLALPTIRKVRKINPDRIAVGHYGYVNDVVNHLNKCEFFVQRFLQILENPKLAKENLKKFYDSLFFPGCTDKYHRLRGHMNINYIGIKSIIHPEKFVDYFNC